MKSVLFAVVATSACVASAVPTVSNVSTSQSSGRRVTITYDLSSEAGVVTADVRTNRGDGVYISIGDSHLRGLQGDVNRKVTTGAGKKIYWHPGKEWPEGGEQADIRAYVTAWSTKAPPPYMAVDLDVSGNVMYFTSEEALPQPISDDVWRTRYLLMRKIPARGVTWTRGADPNEQGYSQYQKRHIVQLTCDYYMGVFELTQLQSYKINGDLGWPSPFSSATCRDTRPVNNIQWDWAKSYANCLNNKQLSVGTFAVPTDAQWEYAARAGVAAAYTDGNNPTGSTDENLGRLARYNGNAGSGYDPATCDTTVGTARVGSYGANAWGLYDMLGNVSEVVKDNWSSSGWVNYSTDSVYVDPTGPASNEGNCGGYRGGSYQSSATTCRLGNCTLSTYNKWVQDADLGCRLCCVLDAE